MAWKIWRDRGFCAFGEAISAYVDFNPTPSGAIRCIGPFSRNSTNIESIKSEMQSLTVNLEKSHLTKNQFVMWGTYCDYPTYEEHEIDVLGTTCGFIPAPWLRTDLLGYSPASTIREWSTTRNSVTHRSGLKFPNTAMSVVDPMLFHPTSTLESVAKLYEQSNRIAQYTNTDSVNTEYGLPLFQWSLSSLQKLEPTIRTA